MEEQFDFDEVLKEFRSGKKLTGKGGLLSPLIKQLTEAALEAEVESHIANDVLNGNKNRRNGVNKKTIKGTSDGTFELETPRDRNGTFEPQIVKKHQTTISNEIEEKILSMYGLGMSYNDISSHIEEIYNVSISTATISTITDKIISKVKEWQSRPLDSIYPFVWLDAIHYKIKDGGKYVSKAVYTVLGVDMEGKKNILGLYLSESEGANFWLSVTRSDITYIPTKEGWLYLAVVIDIYSRKVVGWSMRYSLHTSLVNDALLMAIKRRNPNKGLIYHTDRGSQYASYEHKDLLEKYGIIQSMSKKGDCWDNAVAESFFHSLKTELIHHETFLTRNQANEKIFEYIEIFYNRQRLHSSNNYMSPTEFEEKMLQLEMVS